MSTVVLKKVADALVTYCKAGQEADALAELYDPAAVSMEAAPMPDGRGPETVGIEGIKGKHTWWADNFEVHAAKVDGPFLHDGDRFAVIFEIDATHKPSGQREAMREVAIYTLNSAGKIAREEFYMSGSD